MDVIPLQRRPDLLIEPFGDDGQHVIKDPLKGTYFKLPPVESFLLHQLDGCQSVNSICQAFQKRFGEPLTPQDLDQFVEVARAEQLLVDPFAGAPASNREEPAKPKPYVQTGHGIPKRLEELVYMRFKAFDPDRLFSWLAPKIPFFWTPAFVVMSVSLMCLAAFQQWTHRVEFADYFFEVLRWETLVLAWLVILVVTTLHEFGHGLTCKHHGREVHEIGFLFLFFMPCFYCNVTDAWLIKEKSKRLWVSLAGSYVDMCFWALGVLVWRIAMPGTFINHMAWIVLTVCGGRMAFNFFPFFKLDGYYLLSDWVEIPNLRQKALDHFSGHVRSLLWGATRPEPHPKGRFLVMFGCACWMFVTFYLSLIGYTVFRFLHGYIDVIALVFLFYWFWVFRSALWPGFVKGEVRNMLRFRRKRTVVWLVILLGLGYGLFGVTMENRVNGTFKTRPIGRAEVRASVSGFLQAVHCEQGDSVRTGDLLVCMDVPDLASRMAQKKAEEQEAQAKLKLLQKGARPEEIAESKQKVQRAQAWCDRAKQELDKRMAALREELEQFDQQIALAVRHVGHIKDNLATAQGLYERRALARDVVQDWERQLDESKTQLSKHRSQKRERMALGNLEAESELIRRERDLADAQATLRILEAGTRPEEIEAEKARLSRIQEEQYYLEKMRDKLRLVSPLQGVITTPYLRDRVGQYFREGELICEVENLTSMEVEIPLDEQDINHVVAGLSVELKPRSLPLHTLTATVKTIAPYAVPGKVQSMVAVNCHLEESAEELLPGMTGYARIYCGTCTPASYMWNRFVRYLRTEVWW